MMLSIVVAVLLASDGGVVLGPCKVSQTFCFSPGGSCDTPLIAAFDSAKSSIDVMIYNLNRDSITSALIRAKSRGIAVRVIVDSTQTGQTKTWTQLTSLYAAGVQIKRDVHSGIMHMKVSIIDDTIFAIGSYNYTDPATLSNDENLMLWSCPRNALIYKSEFDKRWQSSRFKSVDDWFVDGGI